MGPVIRSRTEPPCNLRQNANLQNPEDPGYTPGYTADPPSLAPDDCPRLRRLVAAWLSLPDPLRRAADRFAAILEQAERENAAPDAAPAASGAPPLIRARGCYAGQDFPCTWPASERLAPLVADCFGSPGQVVFFLSRRQPDLWVRRERSR